MTKYVQIHFEMYKILLVLFSGHSFETKKWTIRVRLFKADYEEYIWGNS